MANVKRAATSGLTKTGTAIPDVPDAPTIGAATDVGTSRAFNNGAATVAITSAAATGGTPTSYTVTSSPGGFTATGTSPVTVTGLSSNTAYTFTAQGVNSTATGPASAASNSITATTVPATMSAPTASDSGSGRAYNNGSASVSFSAPATGGKAITGYTVTSSPGSYTGTGSSSPITVTGQQSATAYTYTVTATNANGTSTASPASGSVTATTVPQAPTIGTFTDGGTGTSGTLSFTAGATGGSAITNYKVSTDNITFTALSPAQTTSPLSISGLSVGTYTFYIKAVNANGDSTASSGVSGTVIQPNSYESIATLTPSGTATATFSNIPQTYKNLEIRAIVKHNQTNAADYTDLLVSFNGNALTKSHMFAGDTSVTSSSSTQTLGLSASNHSGTTSIFNPTIINVFDYTSTSKNKTAIGMSGIDANAYPRRVVLTSAFLNNTAAITSISLTNASANFWVSGTEFALYGIKG